MYIEKLAPTAELSLIMICLQRYKPPLFGPVTVFPMEKSFGIKSSTEVSLVPGVADLLPAFPRFFLQPFFWPFLSSNSRALAFKIAPNGLRFHFIKVFSCILLYYERMQ